MSNSATPWTAACQASLSFTVSWSLFKCMSTQVCDVILPSHPLLPPSPPVLNPSHYQGLFQWVGSSHQVTKVLELHSASTSVLPVNIHGWFPLGFTSFISLLPKGLSRVFSSITIQRHRFFGVHLSLQSKYHICTWLLENHRLTIQTFVSKVMSLLFNMLSRFIIAFFPKSNHVMLIMCKWKSLSHVRLFATPWPIQSMEFSRPEYWCGYTFPSPGDLPNPGIEPRSAAFQANSLPTELKTIIYPNCMSQLYSHYNI